MLKQISWTTYIEIVVFLLVIYYAFIMLKYYSKELRGLFRLVKEEDSHDHAVPEVLRYEAPSTTGNNFIISTSDPNPENQPDGTLAEADELISQLKQTIQSASGKPFAPAVLIPQIKKLFRSNPSLGRSPHRPAINELVVMECERLGTALLTEDEVDQWWNE
jgi:hypothetical protein